jgi:hypothetical protein
LLILSASSLKAVGIDALAYVIGFNGNYDNFGVIGLGNGATSEISSPGALAGLGVANGTLYAAEYLGGALYQINTSFGTTSIVGYASGVNYFAFGSTLTTLYAVGTSGDLYSIDPTSGAATEIGPTGIGSFASDSQLSTNSGTLFYADGTSLYTLNTSNGAATFVASFSGSEQMESLIVEGDALYGADANNNIVAIDTSTGAVTVETAISGAIPGNIGGLAPDPLPTVSSTPEPGSVFLLAAGLAVLMTARKSTYRRPSPSET